MRAGGGGGDDDDDDDDFDVWYSNLRLLNHLIHVSKYISGQTEEGEESKERRSCRFEHFRITRNVNFYSRCIVVQPVTDEEREVYKILSEYFRSTNGNDKETKDVMVIVKQKLKIDSVRQSINFWNWIFLFEFFFVCVLCSMMHCWYRCWAMPTTIRFDRFRTNSIVNKMPIFLLWN